MSPSTAKDRGILQDVGDEVKSNPPSILAKTRAKFGPKRARKQQIAILLSKARRKGANI